MADETVTAEDFKTLRQQLGWTQVEAMEFLKLRSLETVQAWERGTRARGIPYSAYALMRRELESLVTTVPLLGVIPAGPRSWSDDDVVGTVRWTRPNLRDKFFALIVRGTSMSSKNYLDGDTVIVQAQSTATLGSVVVARVDGDATMKELQRINGRYFLDGDSDPVYPEPPESLRIIGVVVDRLRPNST